MEAKRWQMVRDVARLFYPDLCPGCGAGLLEAETYLCMACLGSLPRTGFGAEGSQAAARIFHGRVNFTEVFSFLYFHKSGLTQKLLHSIKYKGGKALAFQLGQLFGNTMGTKCSPELLIPVPLHASRLQQRGYNQSEAIARGMAAVLGKEVTTKLLIREGSGRGQTRASRLNRWSNVETKFNCLPADYAGNTHIGLIDDVLTTGATLEACHRALDKAGYRHISAFTLAYAEY